MSTLGSVMNNALTAMTAEHLQHERQFADLQCVGTDVANAQSGLKDHQALLTPVQNVKQSMSGVSIDEETVNIFQFQRSFQASARLIQTVDQLLQTALAMGATTTGA